MMLGHQQSSPPCESSIHSSSSREEFVFGKSVKGIVDDDKYGVFESTRSSSWPRVSDAPSSLQRVLAEEGLGGTSGASGRDDSGPPVFLVTSSKPVVVASFDEGGGADVFPKVANVAASGSGDPAFPDPLVDSASVWERFSPEALASPPYIPPLVSPRQWENPTGRPGLPRSPLSWTGFSHSRILTPAFESSQDETIFFFGRSRNRDKAHRRTLGTDFEVTSVRHALSREVLESLTSSFSAPLASEKYSRRVASEDFDRSTLRMIASGLDGGQEVTNWSSFTDAPGSQGFIGSQVPGELPSRFMSASQPRVLRQGDVSFLSGGSGHAEKASSRNVAVPDPTSQRIHCNAHANAPALSEFPKASTSVGHINEPNKEETEEVSNESKRGLPALNWTNFEMSDRRLLMDCLSGRCTAPNLGGLHEDSCSREALHQMPPSDGFAISRDAAATPYFPHEGTPGWPGDATESAWAFPDACTENSNNPDGSLSLSQGNSPWRLDLSATPAPQALQPFQSGRLSLPSVVPTEGYFFRHEALTRNQQPPVRCLPVAKSSPSLFPHTMSGHPHNRTLQETQRRPSQGSLSGGVPLPPHMLDSSFSADSDPGDPCSMGPLGQRPDRLPSDALLIEKGLECLRQGPNNEAFDAMMARTASPMEPPWERSDPISANPHLNPLSTETSPRQTASDVMGPQRYHDLHSLDVPTLMEVPSEFQIPNRPGFPYRRGTRWSSVDALHFSPPAGRGGRVGREIEPGLFDRRADVNAQPSRLRARSELRGYVSERHELSCWLGSAHHEQSNRLSAYSQEVLDLSDNRPSSPTASMGLVQPSRHPMEHPLPYPTSALSSEAEGLSLFQQRCQGSWPPPSHQGLAGQHSLSHPIVHSLSHSDACSITHQQCSLDSSMLPANPSLIGSAHHVCNMAPSYPMPSFYHDIHRTAPYPACHLGGSERHRTDDLVLFGSRKEDLAGRVLSLAKFQSGSRFLQRFLSRGNPPNATFILNEVHDKIAELMVDPYGNYLCQQLFEVCTTEQRSSILGTLANKAVTIARDRRGTHSMQALISLMNAPEEAMLLMKELHNDVLQLAIHPHGTHVLQRALTCFSEPATGLIFEPVIESLDEIARNPHGLCVVKKCITAASRQNSKYISPLAARLSASAIGLIQSPYGNYAIQHALDVWGPVTCKNILMQVKANLVVLSTQKFSSNVVEKTLEVASSDDLHDMLRQLGEPHVMSQLINSSYGNFVVQKALEKATDEELEVLSWALSHNVAVLQNRRLKVKWEKIIETIIQRLGTAIPPGISMREDETMTDLSSAPDFHFAQYHTPAPHVTESATSSLSPETLPSRAPHSSFSDSLQSFTKAKSGHARQGGQRARRGRPPPSQHSTTTENSGASNSGERQRRQYQFHRRPTLPLQHEQQPRCRAGLRMQRPELTRQNLFRGHQVPQAPFAVLQRSRTEQHQDVPSMAQVACDTGNDTFRTVAGRSSPRRGRRGGRPRRHPAEQP